MTGSLTHRTYTSDTITVQCDQCGREGRFRRAKLLDRFGPDMAMPDILNAITEDCGRITQLLEDLLHGCEKSGDSNKSHNTLIDGINIYRSCEGLSESL